MKIHIFSFAVNDKFPIDIAHRQFTKYLKDDFEYILFNDASNAQTEKDINMVCDYNKIKNVRIPQSIHNVHNPSECYGRTLNWAVRNYAVTNNCETIVLMHADVFPIFDVSISNILGNSIAASTAEFRILNGKPTNYFYPAFTIINMKLLKNVNDLDFGLEPGLDVGGKSKDFIEKNTNSIKFLPNHQTSYFINTMDSSYPLVKYFTDDLTICKNHGLSTGWIAEGFYHYMAGSQWNSANPTFASGHEKRMNLFLNYFY